MQMKIMNTIYFCFPATYLNICYKIDILKEYPEPMFGLALTVHDLKKITYPNNPDTESSKSC